MTDQSARIAPTRHSLYHTDSRNLSFLEADSVDLAVTSPPYPMILMWDRVFQDIHPAIAARLEANDGMSAFKLMHGVLEAVWDQIRRVVKPGGFVCINIGDATRTVGTEFRLYPNHSRIEMYFLDRGFDVLPRIIWRKTTNAPTKFMGSGMLPAGAYVTLEHEYILIFRKKGKRDFGSADEKQRRRSSAIFWEERNAWYSDLWELAGQRQDIPAAARSRSAAFPFEIAYRLISMYSLQGDTVIDPFVGTGTTVFAAIASGRNSLGADIDASFISLIKKQIVGLVPFLAEYSTARLTRHQKFVESHANKGKILKYKNHHYGFAVKTMQEREMVIPVVGTINAADGHSYQAKYTDENSSRFKEQISPNLDNSFTAH